MFSTAILLAASMVGGETHGGMPEELRQHIDKHVIGEWTTQTAWGDKVAIGERRSHWASGGKCVITEATDTDFTGEKSHVASVLGWDAGTRCLVEYSVTSKGEHWQNRWTGFSSGKWTGQGSGFFNGKEWNTPAEIQWTEQGARYEDTTEGRPFVIVYKRKTPRAAREDEPTAKDYIAMQQNYFAGEWTTTGVEGEGAGTSGTWTCRLDSCGTSFHETATADGKPFFQSIGGYDPLLRGFKEVVFYADGSTATLLYRHPLKAIKGSLVGKKLRGTMERVSPEGKRERFDVLVAPVEQDKSILTFHKKDDPEAVVVKVVFERKK